MGNSGRFQTVVIPARRWVRLGRTLGMAVALVGVAAQPAIARIGGARLGPPPKTEKVRLVLPLKVDAAGLERQALAVSTPGSPQYEHYESVATLARRFGASVTVRNRAVAYLRATGASDVRVDATGLLAEATIDVGRAERLFAAPEMQFRAQDGTRFIAPTVQPRVPRALVGAVEGVFGLDTRPVLGQPQDPAGGTSQARAASSQPSSELARTGTPSGCADGVAAGEVNGDPTTGAFTPNQYLHAYGLDLLQRTGLLGEGQRVALIEADSVKTSDLSSFARCFGLRIPPVHQIGVGSVGRRPPGAEAILDTEILDAAAPGLSGIDIYETKPDLSDILAALIAPLQRPGSVPGVMSISLGSCEPAVRAALGTGGLRQSQIELESAAVSGVTIVAASGDTGSAGCRRSGRAPEHRLAVLYPASSWWVTAVGGTNLRLTTGNEIAGEFAWNDAGLGLGASGGGLSSIWTRPPYQDGFVSSNSRAVPDVSMLADVVPGYAIYCTARDCARQGGSSPWIRAGGTSAAAPLFAGGVAIIDQVLHAEDRNYLGDLNPLLYVATRDGYGSLLFTDVTQIGNDIGPFIPGAGGAALGCCAAKPGYDEATGLGSVNLAALEVFARQLGSFEIKAIHVGLSMPSGQHPVRDKMIVMRVSCSRACHVLADVNVKIGRSATFEIVSKRFHLHSAGSRRALLVFTASEKRSLGSALARHTKIVVLGYGVATSASGKFEAYSTPLLFSIKS